MDNSEYQRQIREWGTLPVNLWNDNLLKASAARNKSWSELYSGNFDLGNHTLSGSDAKLVSQYFAAKGLSRNEEWIGSNQDSYWQRQLRDAQNWASQNDKTQALYKAEMDAKAALVKEGELKKFQDELAKARDKETQDRLQQLLASDAESKARFDVQLQEMKNAQDGMGRWLSDSNRAQQVSQLSSTINSNSVRPDSDSYQSELAQANNQMNFIRSQLGAVGADTGFLSKYDITDLVNQANTTGTNYNTLRGTDLNAVSQNPDAYLKFQKDFADAQSGIMSYDSQVRERLSGLSSLYRAYNQLGDITKIQSTSMSPQDRLGSLLGIKNIDMGAYQKELSSATAGYGANLIDLVNYEGDTGGSGRTSDIINKASGGLQESINRNKEQYNSGLSNLLSSYVNPDEMLSGRVPLGATRLQGLLSADATQLTSTLSNVKNSSTQMQAQAETAKNNLINRRISDRNAFFSNKSQTELNNAQTAKLKSYSESVGKQLTRYSPATRPDDELNRYSLFR